MDNCRCCPKCVNVDQEPCGGLWGGAGECASGLNCFKQFGLYIYLLLIIVKLSTLNFSSIFFEFPLKRQQS